MAATVYIIRHAEAEGNIYRRCHGLYDSLLTPRAYQQLPCLAKRFENVPLAAVYASPLFRARTTAQAVAAPHGLTVELRNDLHEIDMGDWEDLPWAELPHGWPDQYAKWCARPWEAAPPHGETVMQAGARMLNEVRRLAQENDGKAIAVVTHGSAIRGALTIAHGFPPEKMNEIGWGDNTCVARLDFADDGSIDVVYENDASHLPQELSTFACIGRSADYILKEQKPILRVFIYAPDEVRIENVMKSHNLSADDARLLIEEKDKRYHKRHLALTGANRGDRHNRDMLIDSSLLGPDGTAALIEEVARKVFNS